LAIDQNKTLLQALFSLLQPPFSVPHCPEPFSIVDLNVLFQKIFRSARNEASIAWIREQHRKVRLVAQMLTYFSQRDITTHT
jgi:hypothetical protein